MNNLDSNRPHEIDTIIFVSIIAFSVLVGCTYMLDSYVEMAIVFIFGVVLLLFAKGNETIHHFTNSCKWL